MTLTQLRYFAAVARSKSLSRAADELHIAQPAITRQLKLLETELEAVLFTRHHRGVELTDAGRALLGDARAIMAQVEHAFASTRRTARGEQAGVQQGQP